jgi:predicted PurR-regulated permease PerM
MHDQNVVSTGSIGNSLVILASIVIIIAGLQAAATLVTPLHLAIFFALVSLPPYRWLRKKKVPTVVALLFVIFIYAGILMASGLIINTTVNEFSASIPKYQERLSAEQEAGLQWLEKTGLPIPQIGLLDAVSPSSLMVIAGDALGQIANFLANGFLVGLTVIFMLLETATFADKLRQTLKNPEESLPRIRHFSSTVQRYLALKTIISLSTGFLVWTWLTILGVDFALLWGFVAFLLNYIPNVGSIIAALPAVLLAFAQMGIGPAILTLAGYLVINNVIGNIIEPRIMGKGLGLSTLVVFVSLIFWGWVFGVVGMLLAIPLTMVFKIGFDSSPHTRWIARLMSDKA